MIERFIDYMSFSAQFEEMVCVEAVNEDKTRKFEPIPAIQFYKRGYRDKFGIRYYFGNPKSQKAQVVCSGSVMENLRSLRNDYEIVGWALEAGGQFSRIDLAVTNWQTLDGMIFVEDVQKWVENDLIDSALLSGGAKTITEVCATGKNVVQTLYVGSMKERGKKGIFRAYDKGIELDLGPYIGTRLELELKREKADIVARRLAETNDISGNFRAYFNVKHREFERLMDADAVSTKRGKAKEREEEEAALKKRWEWLINQVAPSLRQAIEDDRKNSLSDINLIKFLNVSGLATEMSLEVKKRVDFEIGQRIIKEDTLNWD